MRIVVIGSSGAGKSTLAQEISQRCEVHHLELDGLHWLPGWVERDDNEFRALVSQRLDWVENWVVDGNYAVVRDCVWPRASHIVWLNYPFWMVFLRVLKRTAVRWLGRKRVFSGNRERLRTTLFSKDSILYWIVTSFGPRQREFGALFRERTAANPQTLWLEFRHPREAQEWLRRIATRGE